MDKFEEFIDETTEKCSEYRTTIADFRLLMNTVQNMKWNSLEKLDTFRTYLNTIEHELKSFLMEISRNTFEIGVIGREKAGKSSLINGKILIFKEKQEVKNQSYY